MGFFSKGLKNEFETAVVNEPLVFEPLKFYCIYIHEHIFFDIRGYSEIAVFETTRVNYKYMKIIEECRI